MISGVVVVWILRQAEIWYRETSQTLVLRLDRGCLLAEKIGGQDLFVDSFAGEASTQGFHRVAARPLYGWRLLCMP